MDEQAAFETRAVLAPRRARRSRLALLVPALALVATAWAGLSGRSGQGIAPGPSSAPVTQAGIAAGPSSGVPVLPGAVQAPAQALGFDVLPLDEVDPRQLEPDDIVAIAGWYLATEITGCPPQSERFRESPRPDPERAVDPWRFCDRSGVLFASRPMFKAGSATNVFEDNRAKNSGLPAIDVTVDEHVVMPAELERVGGDATAVVVLGRFVAPDDRCHWPMDCPRQLVVDHIAWTPE